MKSKKLKANKKIKRGQLHKFKRNVRKASEVHEHAIKSRDNGDKKQQNVLKKAHVSNKTLWKKQQKKSHNKHNDSDDESSDFEEVDQISKQQPVSFKDNIPYTV